MIGVDRRTVERWWSYESKPTQRHLDALAGLFPATDAQDDTSQKSSSKLDKLMDLGRLVRRRAAEPVAAEPAAGMLFVNLHPRDLQDEELASMDAPLSKIASRVVLEITERASVSSISVPFRT